MPVRYFLGLSGSTAAMVTSELERLYSLEEMNGKYDEAVAFSRSDGMRTTGRCLAHSSTLRPTKWDGGNGTDEDRLSIRRLVISRQASSMLVARGREPWERVISQGRTEQSFQSFPQFRSTGSGCGGQAQKANRPHDEKTRFTVDLQRVGPP